MSEASNAIALESVRALLGDIHHVVNNLEPADWPSVAGDVLIHHTPPIEEGLLSSDGRDLQKWCRTMLEAMVDLDEDGVRAAALKVKQFS